MIFDIIKKSAVDFWDELLLLMVFNLIWCVGALLVIPFPFVNFGLFGIVKEVGEGRGIKFADFFSYGKQAWKPAYIWGGINLIVALLAWFNFVFYINIEASWAVLVRLFVISLSVFWVVLQLVMLPLYPRLVEPGFKLALRNAAVLVGRHPLSILAMLIATLVLIVVSIFLPAAIFLVAVSAAAMLINNVIEAIIRIELDRNEVEPE